MRPTGTRKRGSLPIGKAIAAPYCRSMRTSASVVAARTPATRDRYVDLLRVISIAVVVFGHWLMAAITFDQRAWQAANVLSLMRGVWILTWILQVMPVFFFVGGFSNYRTATSVERDGGGYASYLERRFDRLLRPTLVFLAIWSVAIVAVSAIAGDALVRSSRYVALVLWFLGVYLAVVALAPPMVRLHRRYGARVPVALIVGTVVVDVLRLVYHVGYVGYLNFGFVWLFAQQLGFFYADGTFGRWPRSRFLIMAGAGLATLTVLVGTGAYPGSMVGVDGDRFSNMNPPTMCIAALTVWLVGLVMTLRDRGVGWMSHDHAWRLTIAGNSMIMTVFLWHLSALGIAAGVLFLVRFPVAQGGTVLWWLQRPVWFALAITVLAGLVAAFGRFEGPRQRRASTAGSIRGVAGALLVIVGVLGFALSGFDKPWSADGRELIVMPVFPALDWILLIGGLALLHRPRRTLSPSASAHPQRRR
jgi:fucose 4-O-acetylase-like acetyltransferase